VPNQFEVGKNKIVHKPTKATFSFDTGYTAFKSVNWGRAGEQLSTGQDYRSERSSDRLSSRVRLARRQAPARPHPIALNSFLSKDTAGSSWTKSMSVA
jgi:hypothetical protein